MEESQDSWDGGDSCRPLYLCRDIKAKKSRVVPQVAESVYSTKFKKKKVNIPYTSPATDGLSQESVEIHGAHPTSPVMDHSLMCISRFPRS